ncbi:MAG TPA: hypothetical protein VNO81_01740 [Candidatus Nitrosotenuis sp.]|nr:hypothetical protein [Candidatus Nitrosotenuis sp.]
MLILWQVPCQGDEAEWRWRVRCLRSGRERCFRRLGDVLAFLAEESGCSPPR